MQAMQPEADKGVAAGSQGAGLGAGRGAWEGGRGERQSRRAALGALADERRPGGGAGRLSRAHAHRLASPHVAAIGGEEDLDRRNGLDRRVPSGRSRPAS